MITTIIVVTILLVVGIISYFVYKNQTNSAWKGMLVDKKESRQRVDRSRPTSGAYSIYYLIFKTDEGKKIKISVNGDFYSQCKIGDKFEKTSGELNPKKL